MVVTLEDCHIRSKATDWEAFRTVVFSLPGTMNLYGIKSEINNYQMNHEKFENEHGTLYVACDFCVRYHPREEILQDFKFRSYHGWGDFKGREFIISEITGIRESDDATAILSKIRENKNLGLFIDSFFCWLNRSIERYGEKFYSLNKKVYSVS